MNDEIADLKLIITVAQLDVYRYCKVQKLYKV